MDIIERCDKFAKETNIERRRLLTEADEIFKGCSALIPNDYHYRQYEGRWGKLHFISLSDHLSSGLVCTIEPYLVTSKYCDGSVVDVNLPYLNMSDLVSIRKGFFMEKRKFRYGNVDAEELIATGFLKDVILSGKFTGAELNETKDFPMNEPELMVLYKKEELGLKLFKFYNGVSV